ncbi:hypothetical protein PEBR_21927 [Penicillium brasilianum]|uniref:ATP-dependent DNA helicase n=1 Tax=Penicillium brasilianum TaxID=104259 RepID=A0A1S9RLD0_PENBI|nr:hypothetical protein PEBR_21927 [Penicillium brasilianum]
MHTETVEIKASEGVIHYERGRTAHSAFGIPIQETDVGLQSKVGLHSGRAELLREAAIIIWEELPMAKKAVLECANQLLQDIMGNDLPFGDKLFIGLGDFRQVAPVIRGSSGPAATLNSSIRTSELWHHFQILRLTLPVRDAGDPAYSRWVDQVGDGRAPYEGSVSLQHLRHLASLDDAANSLFLDDALQTSPDAVQRAFLSPFNARVDSFNGRMLEYLSGPASISLPLLVKELDDATFHLPTGTKADLLSMVRESGVPPHDLSLKKGCIASIMRNLCTEKGLAKNQLKPISEPAHLTFYLPRITFEFKPQRANWTVQRRQFPLRLAYATTFNSCQGLTLDRVVLDLTVPVFAHGQLYTSLSRVRTAADICILRDLDETGYSTVNIVYHDLLLPV